ncbi:MAG: NADH-quinone oxidoreductase subunit C, partial [Planctomycetes bacterium]|nr:NADH-quinone oxidoreductase subunit C [Planctomycetota bacterium]
MANTAPNPVLDADPGLKIAPESVAWICPCPENADLYRPVGPNDPDIQALAESIREYGLREPLTITEDGYILSGHRRWEAAKLVGLTTVPCRTEPMRYCDRTSDEIVRLLREHNRQRVKSLDEILREEVVMVDSELAYHRLLRHRIQKSNKSDWSQTPIDLTVKKCRKRISDNKREMLDAAIGGKVAVDLPQGKNLVGAFYQPKFVLADVESLQTLPERELTSGWAEGIKHGLILDENLFDAFERQTKGIRSLERETAEMFGVRFEGHPDPRALLLSDDMDDTFPLRKAHPLAEIEVLQGEGIA